MKRRVGVSVFCLVVLVAMVQPALSQRSVLSHYELADLNVPQIKLPRELSEVSGLAVTSDGRLLAHNDEEGIVFQIDVRTGIIIKRFGLGSGFIKDDFEDIACAGGKIYMVSSGGTIYEFTEGKDSERKKITTYKTKLTSKNDVEGLAYDPASNSLLLACKGYPGKGLGEVKAVYSFGLDSMSFQEKPRFVVALKDVIQETRKGKFSPSGVARTHTGTFFIIASEGEAIIEVDSTGKVLEINRIPKKTNTHPEGIAFLPNKDMILCNDGQGAEGTIVVYKYTPDPKKDVSPY